MSLYIVKAKPNPLGKDKIGSFLPKNQLAGEWIDIKNIGNNPVDLTNMALYHWAYKQPEPKWELVMLFKGLTLSHLPAGNVMRVHSGGVIPIADLLTIDRIGAEYHLFSGKGYVWNNDKSDKPIIWDSKLEVYVDQTSYDAYPADGKILNRVNDKLI